ncbi:hypothetical protein J437_LFUL007655 [Ladona fulva]|uniref:Uncharacterized protein n=1 Tax=Ladona fulva TaxID=123851 RepID=A0A8K0K829_LADFU|nr:hypothetical protein J437_LFUL007655 [Ladona fulva]
MDRREEGSSDGGAAAGEASNRKRALYSSLVAALGFVCFATAATAVGLPLWGHFENPEGEKHRCHGY